MDKGKFFYFSSCNTWANLDEIVAVDYENTDEDTLYIVWCNSLMITISKSSEEGINFLKAIKERFDFINKKDI